MALPKEPRQKMINLMYLVLTALLALNVSAEILNAFVTVNNSLGTANATIDIKNQQLLSSLNDLKNDPKTAERAGKWEPLAVQAQALSEQMIKYIEDSVKMAILKASKYDPKTKHYNQDELEGPTHVMADPGTKGKELHDKLAKFREDLLNLGGGIMRPIFEKSLPLDLSTPPSANSDRKKSWSDTYFNMVPAVAAITILSKFENDVKNSEAMII